MRCGKAAWLAVIPVVLLGQSVKAPGWPARNHDNRRTGMSGSRGPGAAGAPFYYAVSQGLTINISPTVDAAGNVYFGTWGLGRTNNDPEPEHWDKFDGRVYSLSAALSPRWTAPLAFTPACTLGTTPAQPAYCPTAGDYYNGYNGTVEGAGALGPDGAIYYGRGDGRLYAIDAVTGAVLRSALTQDPSHLDDPESGGEIIPAPLYAPDGRIYAATWGVEYRETSAVYAYDAATFAKQWRYPATGSLSAAYGSTPYGVLAAPALSPDGKTLYVADYAASGGPVQPPRIYALRLDVADTAGDAQRLRWSLPSVDPATGQPLPVAALAVGSDGTLYVGATGVSPQRATVYAVRESGGAPQFAWAPAVVEINAPATATAQGYLGFSLALQEEYGATTRLYAASLVQNIFQFTDGGGLLKALDPATGATLWSFDPEIDGGVTGSFGGLALGADGMLYGGLTGDYGAAFKVTAFLALWPECAAGCPASAHKNFSRLLGQYGRWTIPALGPGAIYLGTADSDQACYDHLPAGYGGAIGPPCTDGVNFITPRLYGLAAPPAPRPAGIPDLRLVKQGAEIAMSWSPVTLSSTGAPITVAKYHVIRADQPAFPSLPGTVKLPGEPASAAYLTAGGELANGTSRFYQALALTPQGLLGE